jgi:hypothetical protein
MSDNKGVVAGARSRHHFELACMREDERAVFVLAAMQVGQVVDGCRHFGVLSDPFSPDLLFHRR